MSDSQFNNMDDDDVQISVETSDEEYDTTPLFENDASDTTPLFENEASNTATLSQKEIQKQRQRRTFSHWPYYSLEFINQMVEAGFYYCNIGDRVICPECNEVFEHWRPHIDDPCEVHRIRSPHCWYVRSRLMRPRLQAPPPPPPPPPSPPLLVINPDLSATVNVATPSANNARTPTLFAHEEIVLKSPNKTGYAEIPKRIRSFANWPSGNLPSVDDLVRAGFFYTGQKHTVTCFYCNGSISDWGKDIDPITEHVRLFPDCGYARQLCGDELYRKVQESQRIRQGFRRRPMVNREETGDAENRSNMRALEMNRRLLIPDESILSRLVAARLDLPISQQLLRNNFKLSIIKRCWEDQLRIKGEDFATNCDFLVACKILQKQIERINNNRDNIIIPSTIMRQTEQPTASAEESTLRNITESTPINRSEHQHLITTATTSPSSESDDLAISQAIAITTKTEGSPNNLKPSNPCVICFTNEKELACIPCGHLATCAPCGHSTRSCPICRCHIDAFVRVYLETK